MHPQLTPDAFGFSEKPTENEKIDSLSIKIINPHIGCKTLRNSKEGDRRAPLK